MINEVKIRGLIDEKGLKIKYVVGKTGYSERSFYNYLSGDREAPEDFKIKLSQSKQSQ